MKRAKVNIWCDNKEYLAGQVYTAKEVAHLDPNDFEEVTEVVEEKPKAMTTESLKAKKTKK